MALFEGARTNTTAGKTFSRLVVSDGFSPADKWIADPSLPTLLKDYEYGGIGEIVIPKGVAVGVKDAIKDPETGKLTTVMTIAGGSVKPVGIAPYNIMRKIPDRLYNNLPSLITRDYIEVPYFSVAASVYSGGTPSTAAADILFPWGCAYGTLAVGDYVGVDAAGRLVKLSTIKYEDIVGQVLAKETDLPPEGWLNWLYQSPEMNAERRDDANYYPAPNGGVATAGRNGAYDGYGYNPNYRIFTDDSGLGIKGLTDGGQIGYTEVSAEALASYTTGQDVAKGATVIYRLDHAPVYDGKTVLKKDGVAVDESEYHVDIKTGWIYYTPSAKITGNTTTPVVMTADYAYHDQSKAGTPTAWDFKGSAGAVRILLKF
jgi:hypothetical protein